MVHLLRDIHDLTQVYPADQSLADRAAAVHALYDAAKAVVHAQETERVAAQRDLARARTTDIQSRAELLTTTAALTFAAGD